MKVKAYVLIVTVMLLTMSAATKDVRLVEGLSPGDLAPRIESLGNESDFNFQNHSGRYTLVNFWAAYDAESRARNVRFSNEVSKLSSEKITLCSISLDEKESVFQETVKMDKLNETMQFHAEHGKKSALYKKYNLKKGLRNYLINDEGVIIATNVTPNELIDVLKEI
ncbi:hypothetical protein M2459_000783 [Parabacteroides sp. PF5-5]|uniref:thioredoxin family protein n=1 Tax=unclassified Parabacteroides TaxID=2649774 RepID=UPI00247529D8|nr:MULTISPECIES: thioredoxin-like domain-containing protein [unclassified Parabacteroides]MDH6304071.1 hypothetical protein [Parabacteroides sp. PH5-39]MDH6315229.1 hypothetical protein [Parabacteroides sp. PF5-13]MDH6318874.1 hypothetical protein [Parabacteroides sp. PH5-13]MDH6322603.1 hypothetical protein [Parabacteroides sp. PH5-8]MDH6326245.1 hypothetical protein [Parabacteroides sp. PH5-41]